MADKSTDLADKMLAKVLTNTDFTVTGVYIGLRVGGVEVVGGNYARQQAIAGNWSAPANDAGGGRERHYTVGVSFPVANADWGAVNESFLADALAGGNILYGPEVIRKLDGTPTTITINNGGQFKFDANQLKVTEK